MTTTLRLSLPFLAPGQAQKELFHNESLQILDMLVAAAVEEQPLAMPPATPALGACYIVSSSPSGEWAEHAGQLAGFTPGGWRFVVPCEGMTVYVRSADLTAVYRSGSWDVGTLAVSKVVVAGDQVVGERAAAIAGPASGSVIDAEARTAIQNILSAMRHHGLIEM